MLWDGVWDGWKNGGMAPGDGWRDGVSQKGTVIDFMIYNTHSATTTQDNKYTSPDSINI